MKNQVTFEQEKLLYSKLKGDVKKDYFIDFFVSNLCFALKDRRKELGITQKDIADAMGIKQSYVSKIENYEKVPTIETIAKYCYALNLSLDEVEAFKETIAKASDELPRFSFPTLNKKNWNSKYGVPCACAARV